MKKIIFVVIVLIIILSSCSKQSRKKGNFTMDNQKTSVTIEEIKRTDVSETEIVSGTLEGINDITVISEVSGKVTDIYKKLGDYVKKGEVIAKIDNEDLAIKLEQAKANELSAQANYESELIKMQANEELYKKNAISETEYKLSTSALKQVLSNLKGAQANVKIAQKNYDNSLFKAPISGKIVYLPIKIGEFISNGKSVCGIVDDKKMILKTGVGETIISKIEKGATVEIYTKINDKKYIGKITGIGERTLPDGLNYPIEILINNDDSSLMSGQIVTGKVKTETLKNVIAISPARTVNFYDKTFVFLYKDGVLEKRLINVDKVSDNFIIVKSGLNEGDLIVSSDLSALSDKEEVQLAGEGSSKPRRPMKKKS